MAGELLLHEWNVRVGEKLPSYIENFVQKVISQNSPEKIEIKVENKVYLVTFHPTHEEKEVDIYGFDSQELGTTYDKFLNYIAPYDKDYVENATKEALKGKTYAIDYKIVSANGKERIIHSEGEVTFENKDTPIRMISTVQDVTEYKKAEEKIQNLANIVESSSDAILTLSPDGIISTWNKGAEQIYSHSSEEILGKSVSIFAPDDLKGETITLIKNIKLGEKIIS